MQGEGKTEKALAVLKPCRQWVVMLECTGGRKRDVGMLCGLTGG